MCITTDECVILSLSLIVLKIVELYDILNVSSVWSCTCGMLLHVRVLVKAAVVNPDSLSPDSPSLSPRHMIGKKFWES